MIVGYGNVGQAVHRAVDMKCDMEVAGIVSRNPARTVKSQEDSGSSQAPVIHIRDCSCWQKLGADVAILCGGSSKDLPEQGPFFARFFNTVDSFDTHAHIPPYWNEKDGSLHLGYYETMRQAALQSGHVAFISGGWDPGTFSLMRALFTSCLSGARSYAFYGLTEKGGLSMGHSDAIREIPGVVDARQYTHAKPEAIELVRSGANPDFKPGDMLWRECFVVAETNADKIAIQEEIKNMPNYFEPFETEVHFVSQNELDQNCAGMPHDGLVISVGPAGYMEYKNVWHSNPAGTAGILVAYARAVVEAYRNFKFGALTILDVPIRSILPVSQDPIGYI